MKRRLILLLAILLSGCETAPLPRYTWQDPAEAIRIMAHRSEQVRTVTAQGTVTLTRPDGQSVTFDTALVIEPPDRLRLRAWKFGQAVLDVTIRPDGVWLWIADRAGEEARAKLPDLLSGRAAREVWPLITGAIQPDASSRVNASSPDELEAVRTMTGGATLTGKIDPHTLVIREYLLSDPRGEAAQRMVMQAYRPVGPAVWPSRITATGPEGRIEVRLAEVRVNEPLNPAAFEPPARAQKRD